MANVALVAILLNSKIAAWKRLGALDDRSRCTAENLATLENECDEVRKLRREE